ncbi:hypothetical protein [Falsiroseomonas sp.]|uniref:hypothetical protein n=1 Tax=Falsiroseomonas sp. TaxID=2870721 RepID=UPI003568BB3F
MSCGVARAGARFAAGFGAAFGFAAGLAAGLPAGLAAGRDAAAPGAFAFGAGFVLGALGFVVPAFGAAALPVPGLVAPDRVVAVLVVPALAGARRGFGASSDALGVRAIAASCRFLHLT